MTKVEVCIDSYESYLEIRNLPIDQLEVCSALTLGGLTPTYGLVKLILEDNPKAEIKVMLRPRMGDFLYNKQELEEIKEDLKSFLKLGVKSFVFGVLDENSEIDIKAMKEIMSLSKDSIYSIHRAFDLTKDFTKSLKTCINLGLRDILTSGGAQSAPKGINVIKDLINLANNKITIMPGSGINSDNVLDFTSIGAKIVHLSGKEQHLSKVKNQSDIIFNDYNASDYEKNVASSKKIKKVLEMIK